MHCGLNGSGILLGHGSRLVAPTDNEGDQESKDLNPAEGCLDV